MDRLQICADACLLASWDETRTTSLDNLVVPLPRLNLVDFVEHFRWESRDVEILPRTLRGFWGSEEGSATLDRPRKQHLCRCLPKLRCELQNDRIFDWPRPDAVT